MKKAFLLFDLHHPRHNKKHWNLVLKAIKEEKPDIIVLGGDQLNMETISHWNENKRRIVEGGRLKKEYDNFNEEILKPLEKFKAKIVWLVGNHEDWAEQYLDKNPEMEGIIEPENYLRLKERGIEIVPLNKFYKLGKLYVIHGSIFNGYAPAFHARRIVDIYGHSVAYGHFHTSQRATKVSPIDETEVHQGYAIGGLCDSATYMKNKPSQCVNGFAVVYVYPNNDFQLNEITIIKNKFILNGKKYE